MWSGLCGRLGRRVRWPIGALVLIVLAGVALWWCLRETDNFACVQEGVLYRAASHSMRDLVDACRKGKPRTIVSLLADVGEEQKLLMEEEGFCRERGIRLVHVPVPAGGWPENADIQVFLEIACEKDSQPVLVHCSQGIRRTGMMVAAFQESVLHMSKAEAERGILPFGHHGRSINDIREFIGGYDAATRRLKR